MKEIPCADGGVMLECYRSEGWGQVNIRTIPPGEAAGGHRHPRTDERWLLLRGERVAVSLGEHLFRLPPWEMLDVPANTGHLVENMGEDEAVLLYWRSTLYDPDRPDKETWEDGWGCST